MRAAFLLLALGALGCGSAAVPAVEHARARWAAATGLAVPEPGAVEDLFAPFDCGGQAASGCYHTRSRRIRINVARPRAEVRRTAAHEVGHMLGLADGGSGIMGPAAATPRASCLTATDVRLVCLIHRTCRWFRPECEP